jgi:serine protease Do
MATPKRLLTWTIWALVLGGITAVCVAAAGLLAARYVARQVADAVAAGAVPSIHDLPAEKTDEIDFYQATGIRQEDVEAFLDELASRDHVDDYPVLVTLENIDGDYLAGSQVIVRWKSGTQRLLVGSSGVIQFLITKSKLPGLAIVAPKGYTNLKQRSIPLGPAYEPEEQIDTSQLGYDVVWDGHIQSTLARELVRMRASGSVLTAADLREQLRRTGFTLELPDPPHDELTPEEIYRRRKDSVVIIGSLGPDGRVVEGSGFVLHESGVIATAYHVVDKPTAVARAVMTSDRRVYPITEVLAADKPSDVALIRVEASGLQPAPLSEGVPEGSAVTVISHPGRDYFSLTQGYVSRYYATTQFGRLAVMMTVTAEFADGSSGAPVFNSHGAVTGLVSATGQLGNQMVRRTAAPAASIRKLLRRPKAEE